MKRTLILSAAIVVSVLGLLSNSNTGETQESKFRQTENAIANQYIVVLDPETPSSEVSSVAQSLASTYGGQVGHLYEHTIKGFSLLQASEAAAISLSNDSLVEYVEEDGVVTVTGTQLNPGSWGLDRIDQRNLPLNNAYTYKPTGAGINAYVIDTGIAPTHPDFHGRAFVATDTTGGNGIDCFGHGTHVAGTLGSTTYGVAKGVTIYSVRVLAGCSGQGGQLSDLIEGVDWVRFNRINPAVVNISMSADGISTALDSAVIALINSGISVVIGAGNDGTTITKSPARVGAALTIGATDDTDTRAVFTAQSSSNFGPLLDVFAPGKFINSTWFDGSIQTISGTSMAAPHVAGVVAQYLQLNPNASPATVHAAIVNNATTGVVNNPGTNTPNRLLFSNFLGEPKQATSTDFDGDLLSDLAVWRPSTGGWFVFLSATSATSAVSWGSQTVHNDVLVPGDYDGDGKADRAVWRPATGTWCILQSSDNTQRFEAFGQSGDIPVPTDYDRDTITDIAVWRPSTDTWYILQSSTATVRYESFGGTSFNDRLVPADYDGDGKADVAVWRPGTGTWIILQSSTGTVRYENFGGASFNDVLVPADYDGDVSVDIAVWRPGTGVWYILESTTGQVRYEYWGTSGDIPSVADFDGDGKADVAVWRPSDNTYYILQSGANPPGTPRYGVWGTSGDIPIPSAYNR